MVVLVAAVACVAGISSGCGALESSCVSSEGKIDWDQKPVIDSQGVLTFSGESKDGLRIGENTTIAPFNFSNYKETEGIWNRRLESLRVVGGYNLSADGTTFSVRYRVPDELLNRDRYELVVGVWGADPGAALGAECVKYE